MNGCEVLKLVKQSNQAMKLNSVDKTVKVHTTQLATCVV